MKTIYTLFFCLLLFSCNTTEEKKANITAASNEDTPITSPTETATDDGVVKQQNDYSALFERAPNNCDFITAEDVAKVLGVSSDVITTENNNCNYIITEANGTSASFRFLVQPWSNKQILKEIKTAKENAETFGKDSKLSQYRMSETGDTYLSMHQNRMVRMLNEKANNTIIIYYKANISSEEKDLEKIKSLKDEALENTYAIANYLLNTHKQ